MRAKIVVWDTSGTHTFNTTVYRLLWVFSLPKRFFRVSSYEPGNRAGAGCFKPGDRNEVKKQKQTRATSFATIIALSTLVTLLIKLIRILLKWKFIHGLPVSKAKLICQKHFRPGNRAGVFIWEISSRLPRSRL